MIDPTKPVRLLAHVPHNGNFYHPREYQPGELPQALLVEGVVVQSVSAQSEVVVITQDVVTPITRGGDIVNEITVTTEDVAATPVAFQPAAVVNRVYINRASVDELSKIPGIGAATALKIVTEREKKAFEGLQDLSDKPEA